MTITSYVFKSREAAEHTIARLESVGISDDQISLVMTDKARGAHFGIKESSKVEEGVTVGGTTGGLVGAIMGALLAAGAIAIPGLNLVVTGAVIPALAGLGVGGAAGGLIGGLVGSGIPEHEAKAYEKDIEAGNILLAVKTESSEQKKLVDSIFKDLKESRSAA